MKNKAKLLAAAVLTAGTLGTITAFAATTNNPSNSSSGAPSATAPKHGHGGPGLRMGISPAELAQILGIDQATLQADLKAGQTPAQIAQSKGMSEQTLIADLQTALQQKLDQAVQNGKLSADQEQQLLQKFASNASKWVESTWQAPPHKPGGFGFGAELTTVASILGVDQSTLKTDLQAGQTLAQIAASKGISEQTLIADLQSALQQKLDQAVQNGKLTSAQEQQILQQFSSHAQQLVESKFPAKPPQKRDGAGGLLKQVAQILNIDEQTLQQDLQNGQSIAQVAASKGVSSDSLVAQLTAQMKTKLDLAVQNGKLSADKEQQLLTNLQQRLTKLIQQTGPFPIPRGQHHHVSNSAGSNSSGTSNTSAGEGTDNNNTSGASSV
ncbi:MAG: hypothetical protein K6T31_01565 [Alicyclobacillus sp.]|nr:hypothetical protein [Alicyclobacillus sp.]